MVTAFHFLHVIFVPYTHCWISSSPVSGFFSVHLARNVYTSFFSGFLRLRSASSRKNQHRKSYRYRLIGHTERLLFLLLRLDRPLCTPLPAVGARNTYPTCVLERERGIALNCWLNNTFAQLPSVDYSSCFTCCSSGLDTGLLERQQTTHMHQYLVQTLRNDKPVVLRCRRVVVVLDLLEFPCVVSSLQCTHPGLACTS